GFELDQAIGRRPAEHLAQEDVDRARVARRIAEHVGVGRIQLNVSYQAEVLVLLADDLDELTQAHVLDGNRRIQTSRQALGDRAGYQQAEAIGHTTSSGLEAR